MNRRIALRFAVVVAAASLVAAVAAFDPKRESHSQWDQPITYATKTEIAGFPANESDLLEWKSKGTSAVPQIRQHAWDLFRGLVLNSDKEPLWNHWYTKCDLTLAPAGCDGRAGHATPTVKSKLLNGLRIPDQLLATADLESTHQLKHLEDVGTPQLAEVIFNPEAYSFVHGLIQGTHQPTADAAFQSLLQAASSTPDQQPAIQEFPRNAIAVKTIWEMVAGPDIGGPQPIFVWDPAMIKQNEQTAGRLKDASFWQSKITVDTSQKPCDAARDYGPMESVPLKCFYSVPVKASELYAIVNKPGMMIVNPSFTSNGPFFLVLIGFHVMTREIEGWTWQTFYWSRGAFGLDSSKLAGNPAVSSGDLRWSHYVMDATLSETLPPEPDGSPKISFNPYLEGPQPFGETSNCITCHQYAYYHAPSQQGVGYGYAERPRTPPATAAETAAYKSSGLQMSFLWSLADANAPVDEKQNLLIMEKWFLNLEKIPRGKK